MPETTDTANSIGFEPISEKQMAQHLLDYRARMIAHAVRSFKVTKDDAKDLVGEVGYKALLNLKTYNPDKGAISTFLYKILHNTFIDEYRNKKSKFHRKMQPNTVVISDNGSEIELGGGCEPVEEMDSNLIWQSLDLLPDKYRFLIKELASGKKYAVLTEEFNIPTNTIKSHINSCRCILANSLFQSGLVCNSVFKRTEFASNLTIRNRYKDVIKKHAIDVFRANITN